MTDERKITAALDRNKATEDAELESKKADNKQHADKLLRGFEDIDSSSANRAVWELVQNACDLTSKCEVIIDYSNNGFSFSHNGKPFTSATLISLIKQVSSKYDGDEVGKFGTGFITTHAFGRKFKIDSLLEVSGQFLKVKDFLIDRSPKEWKSLVSNIIEQTDRVYELIKGGEIVDSTKASTTFTFIPESKTQQESIKTSSLSLLNYAPIVLTLNDRLVSVEVIDEAGTSITYTKENKVPEKGIYKTTIKTSNDAIEIYSLRDESNDIEVILPISKNNEAVPFADNVARLFLYYPLIGTENFGCNFLIHSKNFAPIDERNGIHLRSTNEQVQESEKANQKLITRASEIIFEYVQKYAKETLNPINLARINFKVTSDKPLLNQYFQELKTTWIVQFKTFYLVETATDHIEPSATAFLDAELLKEEDSYAAIYKLSEKFWKNIPRREVAKDWTTLVGEWNVESDTYKKIGDLVSAIQTSGKLSAIDADEELKTFYQYLINQEHGALFNNYKLLPNIKGDFRQLTTGLNSRLNLPDVLIEIADVILPDISQRLVHLDFKFNLKFTAYSRKNYATEINDYISKQIGEKTTGKDVRKKFLIQLIKYCKISTSPDSVSVPNRMMKLISRYYNRGEDLFAIETIAEDILEIRSPQMKLLQLFLNDVSQQEPEWVGNHLTFLHEIIETGGNYVEYKKLFQTMSVFPNQLNELSSQNFLQNEESIPHEIKNLYDKVIKPKYPIRGKFSSSRFC
ncbi:MAG: hypothetical protein IPG01_00220 [Chitinophagaceae bacterium]|nr:hypothetical protein [Chitinophagaceae bacterium]